MRKRMIFIGAVFFVFCPLVRALPEVGSGILHTHLSADSGVYTEPDGTAAWIGDGVGFWQDRSGNGHHAVQLDPARRPIWDPNVADGMPALKFDRDDDFLSIFFGTGPLDPNASDPNVAGFHQLEQPNTLFVVLNTRETTNRYVFDGINSTDRQVMAVGRTAQPGEWYFWAGSNLHTSKVTQTVLQIHAVVFNSGSLEHYIGKQVLPSPPELEYMGGGTVGTNRLNTGMNLGAHNGGTMNSDMDVAELVIYQGALDAADRDAVFQFLVEKYPIPSPCPNTGPGTLIARYDGMDVTANGYGRVTSWNDQVGDMDLLGTNPSSSEDDPALPLLAAESFLSGTQPVIRFDGSANGLQSALQAGLIDAETPTTVFVVARRGADDRATYILDGLDVTNRRAFMADGSPRTLALYSEYYLRSYTPDVGLWQVYSLVFNGVCSQIYVDGFAGDPEYDYIGHLPFEGLTVGSRYNRTDNLFEGDLAEVLMYEGALEHSVRQGVEQSLFTKYGIGPVCGAAYTVYNEMDFDKNCVVGVSDLAVFVQEWLKCTRPGDPECD